MVVLRSSPGSANVDMSLVLAVLFGGDVFLTFFSVHFQCDCFFEDIQNRVVYNSDCGR